jgi:hypothetical protein
VELLFKKHKASLFFGTAVVVVALALVLESESVSNVKIANNPQVPAKDSMIKGPNQFHLKSPLLISSTAKVHKAETGEKEHFKGVHRFEVTEDLPSVGKYMVEILKDNPDLNAVVDLHRSVLRIPEQKEAARRYFSNPAYIEKWKNTLIEKLEPNLSAYQLLLRSYALDALNESLIWEENPSRNESILAAKRILTVNSQTSSSKTEKSVLASELTELWGILKPHLSNSEEINEVRELTLTNWNQLN